MVRFGTLLKRIRNMGEVRSYESIQTTYGCETMTPTQACRFRELQSIRVEGRGNRRKTRPHYTLKEAARLLRSEVDDILLAAASGRLHCCVMSPPDLRGHWRAAGDGETRVPAAPARMPKYLALRAADCRQIAAYGGVKVYDLEYPANPEPDGSAVSTFILREPMWVDRKRIVLKHPLPK